MRYRTGHLSLRAEDHVRKVVRGERLRAVVLETFEEAKTGPAGLNEPDAMHAPS